MIILDMAKSDHRIWVGRVAECINGNISIDPSQVTDHHQCRLGKWYFGEGMQKYGNLPSFKSLDKPHARLHSIGKEAIKAFVSGDMARAKNLYKEMESVSNQIVSILDEIKIEAGKLQLKS